MGPFLGHFGNWKVVGHNALTACPFHQDDQPSFSIDLETGLWYCFGCGARGNAEQLESLLGFPVWDSVKREVLDVEEEVLSIQLMRDYPLAFDHLYLRSRGVSNDQVEKFGIRAYGDGVYFPLNTFKGQTVGFLKRRVKREGPRYVYYGRRTCSWPDEGRNVSIKLAAEYDSRKKLGLPPFPVVVTEGVFGALRADAAGFTALAAMGASSAGSIWWEYGGCYPYPYTTYAFDNDYAGWVGLMKAVDCHDETKVVSALDSRGLVVDQLTAGQWKALWQDDGAFITGPIWDVQEFAAIESGNQVKAMGELVSFRSKREKERSK